MAVLVSRLLQGKGSPITILAAEPAEAAIRLMVLHDVDQLPVMGPRNQILGLVSYGSLQRAAWTFGVPVQDLQVRDAVTPALPIEESAELSDLLKRLHAERAVLVVKDGELIGILTDYDTSEHLRQSAEDWMTVQDIEVTLRQLLQTSFVNADGVLQQEALAAAIRIRAGRSKKESFQSAVREILRQVSVPTNPPDLEAHVEAAYYTHLVGKRATEGVDGLEFQELADLIAQKDRWKEHFAPLFGERPDKLRKLLKQIGDIRNDLAHARDQMTEEKRAVLRFCAQWLGRCIDTSMPPAKAPTPQAAPEAPPPGTPEPPEVASPPTPQPEGAEDAAGGAYAPLASWLAGLDADKEMVQATFDELEQVLGRRLPDSARTHRAWWANDSHTHSQARAWLGAGWRVSSINMTEGRITLHRADGRAQRNIAFFSAVLAELSGKLQAPSLYTSPHGSTWHWIAPLHADRDPIGWLALSFARGARLRVDAYIDTGDQARNKAIFDQMFAERAALEAGVGAALSWERLDHRRASRIALYRTVDLSDPSGPPEEARRWAIETILRVYPLFQQSAQRARAATAPTT